MIKNRTVQLMFQTAFCTLGILGIIASFGIFGNKGYSLVVSSSETGEKEIKGVNLAIVDTLELEYILVYFSGNNSEQFVKVVV